MKKYFSLVRQFHGRKNGPPCNDETGQIYGPGTKEYNNYLKYQQTMVRDREVGESAELIKHIDQVLEKIKNIQLKPNRQNDEKQISQLNLLKEKALKNMSLVFDDTLEYVNSIKKIEYESGTDPSSDDYDVKKRENLDDIRRRKHNILIQRIKNTIFFISHAFGNINEDEIDRWEEENDIIADIERVDLPEKIFLPNKINYNDRESITYWAVQIYDEINKLKVKIKNGLPNTETAQPQ